MRNRQDVIIEPKNEKEKLSKTWKKWQKSYISYWYLWKIKMSNSTHLSGRSWDRKHTVQFIKILQIHDVENVRKQQKHLFGLDFKQYQLCEQWCLIPRGMSAHSREEEAARNRLAFKKTYILCSEWLIPSELNKREQCATKLLIVISGDSPAWAWISVCCGNLPKRKNIPKQIYFLCEQNEYTCLKYTTFACIEWMWKYLSNKISFVTEN